mgnify:FL=1
MLGLVTFTPARAYLMRGVQASLEDAMQVCVFTRIKTKSLDVELPALNCVDYKAVRG